MKRSVLFGAAVIGALLTSSFAHADPPTAATLWQAPTTTLQERGGVTGRYITQSVGAGLFLGSYVPSVVVAAASSRDDDKRLFIPVVGPWLDLGGRDCGARPCANKTLTGFLLGVDGVMQALGVVGFLGGTLAPATSKPKYLGTEKLHFSPARIGPDGYGVTAAGSF